MKLLGKKLNLGWLIVLVSLVAMSAVGPAAPTARPPTWSSPDSI